MGIGKPRVVHITTVHPVFDIRIFQKECLSLARAGYEVILVAPHERDEIVEGVRIVAIPRYGNRFLRMTVGAAKAVRKARALNADVYHFHDPELLPWMAKLKRKSPVIYDVHENLPKALLTKGWIPNPLRNFISSLSRGHERRWARGMHLVLAESSYEQDYGWGEYTTVLNLPKVDELLQIGESKHARPTVGYLGAVNASRGSLATVEALAALKRSGIELDFECLGPVSDAHRAELLALANQSGVRVDVAGYQLPSAGWRAISRCHVGLALLHPLPNYLESYPTKVFEYMALGLPVLASDFPLYRALIAENGCGLCVDPLDPAAIAAALASLIADPVAAGGMGARGRRLVVSRYSWDAEASKLLALYASLAPRRLAQL
jgi:glycosyltransferase involved in cell wall biosynthesis